MTPASLRGPISAGRLVLVSIVLVASLAACSGPGQGGSGEASASSSATGSGSGASSDQSGSGGGGGGSNKGGDDGFAYLPWGPTDPPIPEQYAALAGSSGAAPRCAPDNPVGGDFWAVAAAVCRAITAGGQWPTTTTVPAPPSPENAYQACLNDELATMLSAALSWHADNPDRQPNVSFPESSTVSPCQSRVYDVSVLSDSDSPISGANQVPVAVVYSGSGTAADVTVDGQPPEDFADDSGPGAGVNTLTVLVPQQSDPHTAQIAFTTGRGPLTTSVDVPGNGGSGSTSPGTQSPSDDTSTS
ncbi:hypothetical protein [Pengzhenrongella sp.]|jgi:hypothetical protein|uniref:hypothetical protein n=1 Tax=Pengzhenrongella sp. TaxID=2888820 RepID=UPI002F9484EB